MQTKYSPIRSKGPLWRRAKLGASALVVAVASFGTLTGVTALPASAASITSSNFTIGSPTGGVNAVSATPASTVQSTPSVSYSVSFTATAALSSGGSIAVTPSAALGSVPTNGSLVDQASGCLQAGFNGGSTTTTSVTFVLISSCSIASGNKVEVSFTATAPAANVTSYNFGVSTSANATAVASNSITNTSTPPILSIANTTPGANTLYTISQFGAANGGLTASTASLVLTANCSLTCTATPSTTAWASSGPGAYTVTFTPSGGTATSATVTSAVVSGAGGKVVTLGLGSSIPAGAIVSITATGTNPQGPRRAVSISPHLRA